MKRNLLKKSQWLSSNVWIRGTLVLVAMAISDFIWVRYISTIGDRNSLAAASWSAVIIVMGAFITVSYVDDRRLIIPAAIGAFLGTYFAI